MTLGINPLIEEFHGLSDGLKTALSKAHSAVTSQMATQPQQQPMTGVSHPPNGGNVDSVAPPPRETPAPMMGGIAHPNTISTMPSLNQGPSVPPIGQLPQGPTPIGPQTPSPHVLGPLKGQGAAPAGTLQGAMDERARLASTGSGISQVKNPFLRGLGETADVIGQAVAPRLESLIPGTEGHNRLLQARETGKIETQQGENLKTAQTEEAGARSKELEALAKKQNEPEITPLATEQGYQGFNKQTGQATPILGPDNQPLQPIEKQPAFQHVSLPDGSVVAISRDPKTGQVTADEVFKGDGKTQTQITPLEIGGVEHSVVVDKNTGQVVKDLGPTGNKPPVVNVNAQNSEIDRATARLAKPYEAAYKAGDATLQRIQQTLHSVDAGYVGQGLAIPELLTSLVSGQGTGVRITQAELNAITASRGIKGDFESWLNSLAGKGKLTDTDKNQIKGVLQEAEKRLQQRMQVNSDALDAINGAASRDDAVRADKEARGKLNNLHNDQSGPKQGEVIDGYRFKGGDPSDQKNWEQVKK